MRGSLSLRLGLRLPQQTSRAHATCSSTGTSTWAAGMCTFPPVPYQEGNGCLGRAACTSPVIARQPRTPGLSWAGPAAAAVRIGSAYWHFQPGQFGDKEQSWPQRERTEDEAKGQRSFLGKTRQHLDRDPHRWEQRGEGETGRGDWDIRDSQWDHVGGLCEREGSQAGQRRRPAGCEASRGKLGLGVTDGNHESLLGGRRRLHWAPLSPPPRQGWE